jgi:hypothetical protein
VRPKSPLELAEFQALARSQLSSMGRHMSLDQLLDSCQLPLPPIEPGRGAENGEIRFTLPGGADRGSVPAGGGSHPGWVRTLIVQPAQPNPPKVLRRQPSAMKL